MSTYEPGTVATVTYRTNRHRAMRTGVPSNPGWEISFAEGRTWVSDRTCEVTNVVRLVVLDPEASPEPLNDLFAATFLDSAAEIVEKKVKRQVREVPFLRWLADQISEQSKPPRIPEPGLWGVVEAGWDSRGEAGLPRAEWMRVQGNLWHSTIAGVSVAWSDLVDPVLIRDGIEDGAS